MQKHLKIFAQRVQTAWVAYRRWPQVARMHARLGICVLLAMLVVSQLHLGGLAQPQRATTAPERIEHPWPAALPVQVPTPAAAPAPVLAGPKAADRVPSITPQAANVASAEARPEHPPAFWPSRRAEAANHAPRQHLRPTRAKAKAKAPAAPTASTAARNADAAMRAVGIPGSN